MARHSACGTQIQEYADVATTHGIRYMVNSNSHIVDRLLWTLVVLGSTIVAIYGSMSIYLAWQESPVLTTIGTASKPITELDFPAVTICSPGNDVNSLNSLPKLLPVEWQEFWSTLTFESGTKFENMTDKQQRNLINQFIGQQVPGWPTNFTVEQFLQHMTTHHPTLIKNLLLWEMESVSESEGLPLFDIFFNPSRQEEMTEVFQKIKQENMALFANVDLTDAKCQRVVLTILWFTSLPCSHLVVHCIWKGVEMPCSKLFKVIPTDIGLCCSFNHKSPSEMLKNSQFAKTLQEVEQKFAESLDLDIETSTNTSWSPKSGKMNGLTVVVDTKSSSLTASSVQQDFMGVQVTVRPKEEFPFFMDDSLLIQPGYETHVSIAATHTTAGPGLRGLDLDDRKCFFRDELDLFLFTTYSVKNCWMECLMNLTRKRIKDKCVPWNFPRADNTKGMHPCKPFERYQYLEEFRRLDMSKVIGSELCLPECAGTTYLASTTASPFRRCDQANMGLSLLCRMGINWKPPKWGDPTRQAYQKSSGSVPGYIDQQVQSSIRHYKQDRMFGDTLATSYDAYQKDFAVINFYFPTHVATELIRAPKMSPLDFVSQVGGLLGLCLGFSLISAIEIVYWFTIGFAEKKLASKAKTSHTNNASAIMWDSHFRQSPTRIAD